MRFVSPLSPMNWTAFRHYEAFIYQQVVNHVSNGQSLLLSIRIFYKLLAIKINGPKQQGPNAINRLSVSVSRLRDDMVVENQKASA